MHCEPTTHSERELVALTSTSPSLVVFTSVDGAIRHGAEGTCAGVRPALDLLGSQGIPVVLASQHPAAELMALQKGLGQAHPFVCDGGARMYVPNGYFADLQDLWPHDETWHEVPLGAPDIGRAVRLLVSLFQVSGADILTVGLGCTWSDRLLLDAVNVPIIVRNDTPDQARLRRRIPGAYVTTAMGPAGWQEAILGSMTA
jgi:predicted mannosyl-3-phosphoglycerate phosphatase (HAD superfamily)